LHGEARRHFAVEDDQLRTCIANLMFQQAAAQFGVDRHEHRSPLLNAEKSHYEFETVRSHDHYAIARPDASLGEPSGERIAGCFYFLKAM
jgi:hypothetical protein